MKLIIRKARITDSGSTHNGKTTDLLLENGVIREIKPSIKSTGAEIYEAPNLHVSPGWFDMQANFRDPGFEYKEDLQSGCAAAAAGGFTDVCVMPSTLPAIYTKGQIEYILTKSEKEAVRVHPVGAVSVKLEGKDLAEMYDMYLSGAVAFSDDKHAIQHAGLLQRALLYGKNFGGLVITHCDEKHISSDGKMNEGPASTKLGLKGIPGLAEEIMVARNLFLAEYCNARIHLTSITTAKSVDLIRQAKKKNIKVTAAVNAHHLYLDDSLLSGFDTHFKVDPPLRSKADVNALRKGITDGTIDAIVSDHCPEDVENKQVEFDNAAFGMLGLQTAFAYAMQAKGTMKLEKLIDKFSSNPRKILGMEANVIKVGAKASLTFFDPAKKYTLEEEDVRSKSRNCPMIGKKLTGKALGIYTKGKLVTIYPQWS